MGHSCGTLLRDTLAGHSCRTLLWDTLVEHPCRTLLLGTLVGHSAADSERKRATLGLQHTSVPLSLQLGNTVASRAGEPSDLSHVTRISQAKFVHCMQQLGVGCLTWGDHGVEEIHTYLAQPHHSGRRVGPAKLRLDPGSGQTRFGPLLVYRIWLTRSRDREAAVYFQKLAHAQARKKHSKDIAASMMDRGASNHQVPCCPY